MIAAQLMHWGVSHVSTLSRRASCRFYGNKWSLHKKTNLNISEIPEPIFNFYQDGILKGGAFKLVEIASNALEMQEKHPKRATVVATEYYIMSTHITKHTKM